MKFTLQLSTQTQVILFSSTIFVLACLHCKVIFAFTSIFSVFQEEFVSSSSKIVSKSSKSQFSVFELL
ncbi:MAG: hypothetical protein LBQ24_07460 [Candidatus Peribacteria bacterium]|nr:hypothetical protein [Candidatus Peribacteria bacterium]